MHNKSYTLHRIKWFLKIFIICIVSAVINLLLFEEFHFFVYLFCGVGMYIIINIPKIRSAVKIITLREKGEFEEALQVIDRFERKYAKMPAQINQMMLDRAACYNRIGEFQKSIECLEKCNLDLVKKPILKAIYYELFAVNLIMLHKDYVQAKEYLKKAKSIKKVPANFFINKYIEALEGKRENEEEFLDSVKKEFPKIDLEGKKSIDKNLKYKILEISSEKIPGAKYDEMLMNFFMGLYFIENNQLENAKDTLSLASDYKYTNYFTKEAEHILKEYKSIELRKK